MIYDLQEAIIKPNESVVLDYFQRVKSGDLFGLLNMFSDDSIIYEPFSKSKYVTGKSDIESFLRTVIMANAGMQQEIKIEKRGQNEKADENRVVVLVTFHKGGSITGRFTFEFERPDGLNTGNIKTLCIEFVDWGEAELISKFVYSGKNKLAGIEKVYSPQSQITDNQ